MTSRSGPVAVLAAALVLAALVASPVMAQEPSSGSGASPWLVETVTVGAVGANSLGRGRFDSVSRFCGSPFDVRYGPYWSVYLGGPFGYRPFGYRPFGWYGYSGWNVGFGSSIAPFGPDPCGYPFSRGFGWYGRYGGPGWSFWASDPWIWGYGYNPRLAYGYGYAPKSGWWAPYGYGSAPYGSDREVFEDLMRRRSAPQSPGPTRTAEGNSVDAGEDGPDATRFGSTGIRAHGAELRIVRPDLRPMIVLGDDPATGATGRVDGTAITRTQAGTPSRATLGDAIARSRAELAARRIELLRGSPPGDLARRGPSPVRGPEVFVRPIEPPRSVGLERSRLRAPGYEGAIPRGASSFGRRGAGESMGRSTTPRSFSSPPRSSPAPSPARAGGSGGRSGSGKKAAPE